MPMPADIGTIGRRVALVFAPAQFRVRPAPLRANALPVHATLPV